MGGKRKTSKYQPAYRLGMREDSMQNTDQYRAAPTSHTGATLAIEGLFFTTAVVKKTASDPKLLWKLSRHIRDTNV